MKNSIFTRSARPFLEEVTRQRANSTSNLDAYERVEREYESATGKRRYNDFDSFNRVRRRLKK